MDKIQITLTTPVSNEEDQTPTPTKFLKQCEDIGLFNDLQKVNPFDETFKKAIDAQYSLLKYPLTVQTSEDTLNTPTPFQIAGNDEINKLEPLPLVLEKNQLNSPCKPDDLSIKKLAVPTSPVLQLIVNDGLVSGESINLSQASDIKLKSNLNISSHVPSNTDTNDHGQLAEKEQNSSGMVLTMVGSTNHNDLEFQAKDHHPQQPQVEAGVTTNSSVIAIDKTNNFSVIATEKTNSFSVIATEKTNNFSVIATEKTNNFSLIATDKTNNLSKRTELPVEQVKSTSEHIKKFILNKTKNNKTSMAVEICNNTTNSEEQSRDWLIKRLTSENLMKNINTSLGDLRTIYRNTLKSEDEVDSMLERLEDLNSIKELQSQLIKTSSVPEIQITPIPSPKLPLPRKRSPVKDPPPPVRKKTRELSEEEKRQQILERNRLAAKRSRERQKIQQHALEMRLREKEKENKQLKLEIRNLKLKLSAKEQDIDALAHIKATEMLNRALSNS